MICLNRLRTIEWEYQLACWHKPYGLEWYNGSRNTCQKEDELWVIQSGNWNAGASTKKFAISDHFWKVSYKNIKVN